MADDSTRSSRKRPRSPTDECRSPDMLPPNPLLSPKLGPKAPVAAVRDANVLAFSPAWQFFASRPLLSLPEHISANPSALLQSIDQAVTSFMALWNTVGSSSLRLVNGPAGNEAAGMEELELEARLGRFIQRSANVNKSRIADTIPSPDSCVVQINPQTHQYEAEMSTSIAHFLQVQDALDRLMQRHEPKCKSGEVGIRRSFTRDDAVTLPKAASLKGEKQQRKLRQTFDLESSGKLIATTEKRRLFLCDFACIGANVDIRLVLNVEHNLPHHFAQSIERFSRQSPAMTERGNSRTKNRESFRFGPLQVDLTEVSENEKMAVSESSEGKTYEVEFERVLVPIGKDVTEDDRRFAVKHLLLNAAAFAYNLKDTENGTA